MNSNNYSNYFEAFDLLAENSCRISSILAGLESAMASTRRANDYNDDTLVVGGLTPQFFQIRELVNFAHETNWKIIYLSFSIDKLREGTSEIDDIACITKLTPTDIMFVKGGKVWQSGRNEKVSIVFPEEGLKCFRSRKGELLVGGMSSRSLELGYERARATIARSFSWTSEATPILTSFASVPVVQTLETLTKAS